MVRRFGLIAVEDLELGFMLRNGSLSLSAHDAGLGTFFELLEYKAEKAGARLVKVNPKNTSQVCSRCGAVVEKDLSVRVHVCPYCGLRLDRDVNAALNILALGRPPTQRARRGRVRQFSPPGINLFSRRDHATISLWSNPDGYKWYTPGGYEWYSIARSMTPVGAG